MSESLDDAPVWWRVLNLEDTQFEKSRYADPARPGAFRLKDVGVLRRLAPGVYEAAADDVREFQDYVFQHGASHRKYRLGRKIGSIPLLDAAHNPELLGDRKAQDRYWQDHPEMRVRWPG